MRRRAALLTFVVLLGCQRHHPAPTASDPADARVRTGFIDQSNVVAFWSWFTKNDDRLFHFESDQEATFDALNRALGKVNKDLTFEFGPVKNGRREFVISAAGIREAFPAVEALYAGAPSMEHWTVIKFRPRRAEIHTVEFEGVSVAADAVGYALEDDGAKVGIHLFFEASVARNDTTMKQIGYLMLDESLGEYDVETKVGVIEFSTKEARGYDAARTVATLAAAFDRRFAGLSK